MPFYFYFFLTLVLELPVVILFFRKQWKFALIVGVLLNLFTWPMLHILIYNTSADINVLEAGVAIVEGLGYCIMMRCSFKKGFGVSFLANGFSYGAGLLISSFIS